MELASGLRDSGAQALPVPVWLLDQLVEAGREATSLQVGPTNFHLAACAPFTPLTIPDNSRPSSERFRSACSDSGFAEFIRIETKRPLTVPLPTADRCSSAK